MIYFVKMGCMRILSLLLLALALSACSSAPYSANLIHKGANVLYESRKTGSPVVVFQSGLGDGMAPWQAVLEQLPAEIGYFAYDRPGYGGSQPVSGDRTPCAIATELHDLLAAASFQPPYLLVGHSLGGLYQYAFARMYPQEVAGLLLLDATHPEHWATMQTRTQGSAWMLRGIKALTFSDTEMREFDQQADCLDSWQGAEMQPIPAKLLLRGRSELTETAEFRAMSRELAARWPAMLPGLTVQTIEDAGHYLQKDKPTIVRQEILYLLEQSRSNAHAPVR